VGRGASLFIYPEPIINGSIMQKIVYYMGLYILLTSLVFLTASYFPAGFGKVPAQGSHPDNLTQSPVPNPRETGRAAYHAGDITTRCDAALIAANTTFDSIVAAVPSDQTMDSTLIAFEHARSELTNTTILPPGESPDPALSAEWSACREKTASFLVMTYTRQDLYTALKNQTPRTADELRLYNQTIHEFGKNNSHP
jgi:hypothetical protein